MDYITRVNGKTTKCVDMDILNIQMELNMKENLKILKEMEWEQLHCN